MSSKSFLRKYSNVFHSFALLAFMLSSFSFGATPEQLAAARDFAIEGIGLNTTVTSFKAKYPSAELIADESDTACNMVFYRVDSTSSTDGIDVKFFSGKVLEIRAWYFPSRVNKTFGTWGVIAEKLVQKIGKADEVKEGNDDDNVIARIFWRFPDEVNRYFAMDVTTERVLLVATNLLQYKKYLELKKSKADVGF